MIAVIAVLALTAASPSAASAETWFERIPDGLIAFPDLSLRSRFDGNDSTEFEPAIDLFYAHDFGPLRVLAEGFLDRHEQELERLQVGWLIDRKNTVWGGRFHTPVGYWNTEYHHGVFLQTTATRPGIVAFEDHGGVLPMHVAGGLWQGTRAAGHGGISYELIVGVGPELADDGLEPFDFVHPTDHEHDVAAAAKLAWQPFVSEQDEVGAFVTHVRIPSSIAGVHRAELTVFGEYAVWTLSEFRLLGSVFIVHDRVSGGGSRTSNWFVSGYLQGEYRFLDEWTAYSRVEQSTGSDGDPYLAYFPKYTKRAYMGGFRFDITNHQAVKVEVSRRERLDRNIDEVVVQWSAAFP